MVKLLRTTSGKSKKLRPAEWRMSGPSRHAPQLRTRRGICVTGSLHAESSFGGLPPPTDIDVLELRPLQAGGT